MKYLERLAYDAMQKNEFDKFLMGENDYSIMDREDLDARTNYSSVLNDGIYPLYINGETAVKDAYEDALIQISENGAEGVYVASKYLKLQLIGETRNFSPFEIRKEVLQAFKSGFDSYGEELKKLDLYGPTQQGVNQIERSIARKHG